MAVLLYAFLRGHYGCDRPVQSFHGEAAPDVDPGCVELDPGRGLRGLLHSEISQEVHVSCDLLATGRSRNPNADRPAVSQFLTEPRRASCVCVCFCLMVWAS